MSRKGAVCQWHTFSADRNGVQNPLQMQRDPEFCGRQAAGIAACVYAFVTVKPKGGTVTIFCNCSAVREMIKETVRAFFQRTGLSHFVIAMKIFL